MESNIKYIGEIQGRLIAVPVPNYAYGFFVKQVAMHPLALWFRTYDCDDTEYMNEPLPQGKWRPLCKVTADTEEYFDAVPTGVFMNVHEALEQAGIHFRQPDNGVTYAGHDAIEKVIILENTDIVVGYKHPNRAGYSSPENIGSVHWFRTIVSSIKDMGKYIDKYSKEGLVSEYGSGIYKNCQDLIDWAEQSGYTFKKDIIK